MTTKFYPYEDSTKHLIRLAWQFGNKTFTHQQGQSELGHWSWCKALNRAGLLQTRNKTYKISVKGWAVLLANRLDCDIVNDDSPASEQIGNLAIDYYNQGYHLEIVTNERWGVKRITWKRFAAKELSSYIYNFLMTIRAGTTSQEFLALFYDSQNKKNADFFYFCAEIAEIIENKDKE